jgi:hypothetical protein
MVGSTIKNFFVYFCKYTPVLLYTKHCHFDVYNNDLCRTAKRYNRIDALKRISACFWRYINLGSDTLRAGRSGDLIPVTARFSARVQTGPGAPSSVLHNVYRVFPGGKAAWAWSWLPTQSSADVKERVELYLYSPSGPSWPFLGWPLHLHLLYIYLCNRQRR